MTSVSTEKTLSARQLPLPLPPAAPRYERAAFLISAANAEALAACDAWRASDEEALIICGPAASGKTHLAHIVAAPDPRFLDWRGAAADLRPGAIVVFDDLPASDPRAFLSAYNDVLNADARAVLTGRGRPSDWALGLKDLRTRLEAMPRAILGEPDEALIRAVMRKHFADRQVLVEESVVDYAIPRLPRTFEAARAFALTADAVAVERGRRITKALAREIVEALDA